MAVQPIPDGYKSAIPYLIVNGGNEAIEFYKKAFGAVETMRMPAPGGKIGHAELRIGNTPIMLSDAMPDMGYSDPRALGGTPVSLLVYVENVDDQFRRAIDAGAKERRPVENQFYGDRTGTIEDPFGHVWSLATHVEDVPEAEMRRRAEEFMKKLSGGA